MTKCATPNCNKPVVFDKHCPFCKALGGSNLFNIKNLSTLAGSSFMTSNIYGIDTRFEFNKPGHPHLDQYTSTVYTDYFRLRGLENFHCHLTVKLRIKFLWIDEPANRCFTVDWFNPHLTIRTAKDAELATQSDRSTAGVHRDCIVSERKAKAAANSAAFASDGAASSASASPAPSSSARDNDGESPAYAKPVAASHASAGPSAPADESSSVFAASGLSAWKGDKTTLDALNEIADVSKKLPTVREGEYMWANFQRDLSKFLKIKVFFQHESSLGK